MKFFTILAQTCKAVSLVVAFSAFLGLNANSQAVSIWTNPITGTNPNTDNPYTTGQTVNSLISVTGIGRSAGITGTNANNRYTASGWSTSSSISTSDYFTLSIGPAAGYKMSLSSFVYSGTASGSGPSSFALRSDAAGNNFATNIGTAAADATISLTAAAYQSLSAATEFRLYGWNANNGSGTYSVDDFTFNGAVLGSATTSLTGLGYVYGVAPTAQNFKVNGAGLSTATATITISGSTNYEVSTTSATTGFGSSATFNASGGSVSNRDVWVRLIAGKVPGNYNSENITIGGGGVTGITISCSGTVTQAPLTIVNVTANNKTYDGNTTATLNSGTAALSGIVTGDAANVTLSTVGASGVFANKTVGNGKTVTTSGFTISGSASGRYTLTQPSPTANITSRSLTVTATGTNKTYDGTTAATVTYGDNRVAGDVFTATGTAVFANKNIGTGKTISITGIGISGTDAGNYTLSATTASASANITVRTLTVTATGVSRVYDATTTATVTLSDDKVSGDVVTTSYSAASFTLNKHIGTGKTINVTGISITGGADAGNYTLASATASTTANITVKSLTVTAQTDTKVYNGTTASAVAPITGTLETGDVIATAPTQAFNNKAVATGKTLTPSGLIINDGNSGANYSITYTPVATGVITAKSLTVTATGTNKVYNGTTAATVTYGDNRVGGDVFTVTGTAVFDNKNVGTGKTVSVTGIGISGTDAGNYSLSATTASTSANVTVRTLTVSATGVNRVYDGTTDATVNLSDNKVGGDVVTTTYTAATFTDKNIGTGKTVSVSGISITGGTDAGNYTLVSSTASTTATITAKALTVPDAVAGNKVYDGTTAATITGTLTGVVSPDAVTLNGTGTFASANAGNGIAVTSTSTLTGGGNYTLTQPTGLTANITKANQTITFGAIATKTFGNAPFNPGATASSGLTVTYVSSNTAVATVSGTTVTIVGPGTSTITASQGGNGNFNAAADVAQLLTVNDATQASDYFQSKASGLWSAAGTWQSAHSAGGPWRDADFAPTTGTNVTANTITILDQHTVTVATAVSADQLVVNTGGTLAINSGINLTIAAGAGTDLTVNGTVDNQGTITETGTLAFNAASTYKHSQNGGEIPTASWNATSTCWVTGVTNSVPTVASFAQAFGNFTWECTGQSADVSLIGNLTDINGNFSVKSTGSPTVRVLNLAISGATFTTDVAGSYLQTGGNLTLNGTNGACTFNLRGDFTMSGGTLSRGGGTGTFNFAGTSVQTFTKSAGTIAGTLPITINNGATVDFGTDVLNGTATFAVASGGKIITANDAGLSTGSAGTIQVSSTRTYNAGASYEFQGANTGNFAPGAANTVTFNRSAGVTMGTSLTATTLNLTDGIVTTGSNTMTIASGGSISGASSGNYINGKLAMIYSAISSKTFPIGKGGNYRPVTVQFTANPGTRTVTIEQNESGMTGAASTINVFDDRTWTISQANGTSAAFTVSLDGTGFTPTGSVVMLRKTGATVTSSTPSFSSPNYSAAFTGSSTTYDYTLGETSVPTVTTAGSPAAITYGATSVTLTATVTGTPTVGSGTVQFLIDGVNAGSAVSVTAGAASLVYNPATLSAGTHTIRANYTAGTFYASGTSNPSANGTLTINTAPLTITASDRTKTYGATLSLGTTAFTSTGLKNGQTIGGVTLTSTGTVNTAAVGTYPVVASAATGGTFTASNYSITYADGTLTVGGKALTITANNAGKTYGQTTTFAGTEFSTSGLTNGDAVTSVSLVSIGEPATVPVGSYSIQVSDALGAGLSNYTITYVAGSLSVSAKTLTITADDASKTYGQTTTFAGTEFTTDGLVNSDAVTSVSLTSSGAAALASAGSYNIVPDAASGSGLTNYAIIYASGTLTVNPAALTITANDKTKIVGETVTFAGTEFTTGTLQNSETVSSVTLTSAGSGAGATAGTYPIVASAATGGGTFNAGNYTITYVDGTLTVYPVAVGGTVAADQVLCTGATAADLTLSGNTGNVVKWQTSPSSTFAANVTDISNTTTTLTGAEIETALGGVITDTTYFRAFVESGVTSTAFSSIAMITVNNTWLGVTADWNDGDNWSCGIPTGTNNVVIPDLSGNPGALYPVLSGTGAVKNLTLKAGTTLTVTGKLQLSNLLTNNGTVDASEGTVELNGSSAQTISGNDFVNHTIRNLKISNTAVSISAAANNSLVVIDSVSFGNVNNATLITGGNLVLKSSPAITARVADITNRGTNTGNTITGKVTVQRYIPSRRGWRLMTSPINDTTSIFHSWQNSGVFETGKGTFITGPAASGANGNGLDVSTRNNTSFMTFDAINTLNYVAVPNTLGPISASSNPTNPAGITAVGAKNTGYFAFVRGDRNPANINSTTASTITTLSSKGTLQTGPIVFSVVPSPTEVSRRYTLIGNPYASPIELSGLGRINTRDRFYVWDVNLNALGGYVTLDNTDGEGYEFSVSGNPLDNHQETSVIQSGQAFFAEGGDTSGVTPYLVVNEKDKSDYNTKGGSNGGVFVFRPMSGVTETFRSNLYLLNDDNTAKLADGTLAKFNNNYNAAVTAEDAIKFGNLGEMLGLRREGVTLSVERRPLVAQTDTLYLYLTQTTARGYRFEFTATNMDHPNTVGYLEDSYLGTSTLVNLNGTTTVDFSITPAVASKAANRFRVVFVPAAGGPLPVTFTDIKAWQHNRNIAVEWKVENELNIKEYEVERSADGRNFSKTTTTTAKGTGGAAISYSWEDLSPVTGVNYYRIRSIGTNGKTSLSKVVKVNIGKGAAGIAIYPNPVQDGVVGLQLSNMAPGKYGVRLLNTLGQVLQTKEIIHNGGSATETITLSKEIVKGIYILEVTNPDNSKTSINLLNQ